MLSDVYPAAGISMPCSPIFLARRPGGGVENPFSKIVQNPVQNQAAGGRNALLPTKQGQQKPLKNKPVRRSAVACNLDQMASVPPLGLEPRTL